MENCELLSRLPEDLIHRILGFLSTRDALRASFASKSMETLWLSSCPSLHFFDHDFMPEIASLGLEVFNQQNNRFHKYVWNTMSRISRSHGRIRSFKFRTWNSNSEILDRYIDIALDRHAVDILISSAFGPPYCLPERVLSSSSFLKSLALHWAEVGDSVLTLPPLLGFRINLPCLQSLALTLVSMNGDSFETLLKGCPSLEHLNIEPIPELLPNLNISHLKLKSLRVFNRASQVEVEAPCLEEFQYWNIRNEDKAGVIVKRSTSKNLKCLTFRTHKRISMEWLSELLSRCTSLETLDIGLQFLVERILKIRGPYVKNISITYTGVGEIEIDCPMLLSLRWICPFSFPRSSRLIPSLSVINPNPVFEGHLHIPNCYHAYLNTAWFHKLKELLSTSRIATMSWLCFRHVERQIENGDNESLPTSAVKIELLYLMVGSGLPESDYSFIMNHFLSTCHPNIIHLAPPQAIHFIEFFREKLENWKDADGCYCSSKIKCWKHQLKTVEIQEFRKLEYQEPDHYHLRNILKAHSPIHTVLPRIRFKFQWN